jgi:uncharacterized protein YukJ
MKSLTSKNSGTLIVKMPLLSPNFINITYLFSFLFCVAKAAHTVRYTGSLVHQVFVQADRQTTHRILMACLADSSKSEKPFYIDSPPVCNIVTFKREILKYYCRRT